MPSGLKLLHGIGLSLFLLAASPALCQAQKANDVPMFGGTVFRNMVNTTAKDLPTDWNIEGGEKKYKNVKWAANLGSNTFGGVAIAGGKVFVGTNNKKPRDKNVKGPKGVIMCFDQQKGEFLWQAVHDMPPPDVAREGLNDGMCSTPTVVGEHLYFVTPASVVVCARVETGETVWSLDMMKKYKVFPCYISSCSPLVVNDIVYVITNNGTDEAGKLISPDAPSFVAINAKTGKEIWTKNYPGPNVFEGQWSNPTYAEVDGKGQILFAGGDCYLYSLEPRTGEIIWKFYCNSKAEENEQKQNGLPSYIVSTPVVHKNRAYIGIGLYPGHFAGNKVGHFWCIDITKKGDVSPKNDNFDPKAPVNKDSALVWHFGGLIMPKPPLGERSVYFGKTVSTAAIQDGLVYIAEEMGYLHCLDADTGKRHWEHDFLTGIWGSPMLADGKVYVGTEEGDVAIFAHGKAKNLISKIYCEDAIYGAPIPSGSTLFVATKSKLFAIEKMN
jgi:outer membrane protein assembly factor BamB